MVMDKLKKNEEFQNIYKNGEKNFGFFSLVYFQNNNLDYSKFGFVVSKKVGNAVIRNRIKRLFREVIRQNEYKIKKSYDIVIISKKNTGLNIKTVNYFVIEKDILKILKKAGLIN